MKNRNLDFFSLLQAYTMGEQCGVIGAICRNYNRRIEIEEPSMPDKSIESTGRTQSLISSEFIAKGLSDVALLSDGRCSVE